MKRKQQKNNQKVFIVNHLY